MRIPEHKVGSVFGKDDLMERRAVLKRARTDRGHAGGEFDGGQRYASVKRVRSDFAHAAPVRKDDVFQRSAARKRALPYRESRAAAALERDGNERGTACESVFFNGGHKIGDNEPRQADAAVESGSADRRDAGGNGIDARFSRRTIKDYVARLIAQHAVDRRIVRVFLVNVDLLKCGTPAENAQIEKFPRTAGMVTSTSAVHMEKIL